MLATFLKGIETGGYPLSPAPDQPKDTRVLMSAQPAVLPGLSDRSFFVILAVVCTAALSVLAWLLLLRTGNQATGALSFMPALNAALNGLSTTFIVLGYVAIKRKNQDAHKKLMLAAFGSSALFLASYLTYHSLHGDTKYPGEGTIRTVYLVMLASHILLSAIALPLTLTSFFFALRKNFRAHRKVVKFTLPIWLYVSVTGVLVYVMLRWSGAVL
jgi:putative membrane protein